VLGGRVRGQLATLRTPVEADLAAVNALMADMRVRRGGHLWDEPAAPDTWKERLKEAAKDDFRIVWIVDVDGRAAGTVSIHLWRESPGGVSISLFVLDPAVWRRGIGRDVALTLHRYLFDYLDLRIGEVTLPADNVAGLRLAEHLGYREFARGHQVRYRDGGYVDEVHLRLDRPVWNERFGAEREYAPLAAEVTR
jgi:RimJ/RimL family protein N-acetyltransferase